MNNVFKYTFLAVVLGAAGCATPPGKLKPEDMEHATYVLHQPISKVISRLQEADRNCGGLIAGWGPAWYPMTNPDQYKIDLFLKGIGGARESWVAGMIDLSKLEANKTEMSVAIQKIYSRSIFRKTVWWHVKTQAIADNINADHPITCD